MLAFLTVPFVPRADVVETTKAPLPRFRPRWWFRSDRLDARPVAWSLRNHPEEWRWRQYGPGSFSDSVIEHIPSKHMFWVHMRGYYRLHADVDCSCTSASQGGRFQKFQQRMFGRAFRHWLRHQRPVVDSDQFAAHFVR